MPDCSVCQYGYAWSFQNSLCLVILEQAMPGHSVDKIGQRGYDTDVVSSYQYVDHATSVVCYSVDKIEEHDNDTDVVSSYQYVGHATSVVCFTFQKIEQRAYDTKRQNSVPMTPKDRTACLCH